MGTLLGELGKRLADRWLPMLALPGVLYLAVAAAARVLGQRHALDAGRLTVQVTVWARDAAAYTTGGQITMLVAAMVGSATVGLAAQALGSLLEYLTLAAGWRGWPPPLRRLAGSRVRARQRRWEAAHREYHRRRAEALETGDGDRPDPAERHAAHRARTRISLEPPDRPTWSGDRVNAARLRLARTHRLDLATVWPCLWLHLPEPVRAEVVAARQACTRAAVLGGWAVLYAPLAAWWWPAGVLAAGLALTARQRGRTATDAYATLLEAATRMHIDGLGRHLGLAAEDDVGDAVTRHLYTEPEPPPAQ